MRVDLGGKSGIEISGNLCVRITAPLCGGSFCTLMNLLYRFAIVAS